MVSVEWASSSSACGAFSPRHILAGKRDAHDHAVAVRHDFRRAARTVLAVGAGDADMGADISGDRSCRRRDLRRIGEILLRVVNLRAGEAVGIAALERHLHGDAAVRPQLDACGREIDLVRLRPACHPNRDEADKNRWERE